MRLLDAFCRGIVATLVACICVGVAAAQSPLSPAEVAIEQERVRSAVEDALALLQERTDSGDRVVENFNNAILALESAGPEVVPYIINELEQRIPGTFTFCAMVLGHLGTPDAEQALRDAIEQAEADRGEFAQIRKAWSVLGLAVMGKVDAVDLLNAGNHKTGQINLHADMSFIESIALQTAPDSIPRLIAQLGILVEGPLDRHARLFVMRALGRLGSAAAQAVPALIGVLDEEDDARMQREAVAALGSIGGKKASRTLLALLDDGVDIRLRRSALEALDRMRPGEGYKLFVKRLDVEENAVMRGWLYNLVVRQGGSDAIDVLSRHWERAPDGRFLLVGALDETEHPRKMELLRKAMATTEGRVVAAAAGQLASFGGTEAIELLIDTLSSPNDAIRSIARNELVRLGEPKAAAVIAAQLLADRLSKVVTEGRDRYEIELLLDALGRLDYADRIDDFSAARDRQVDPVLIERLDLTLSAMEMIRDHGMKLEKWKPVLADERAEIRGLAYRKLATIASASAAESLARAFGRSEPDEGSLILEQLGRLDSLSSRQLLTRVLTAPEFDGFDLLSLREMAAYSASRLGGDELETALVENIESRRGRDASIFYYLAAIDPTRAATLLDRYRISRMTYMKWARGKEFDALRKLRRRIEQGQPVAQLALHPERMRFR